MLNRLLCWARGHQYRFLTNVHGDRATALACRSIWKCAHCDKRDFRPQPYGEG